MADEGRAASPDLFGIFLEDLNHAIEGGLYAELVKNRTFNMPELLAGWSLVAAPGSEGTMGPAFVPEAGNPNRWKLRLQIVDVAGGRVGIANEGYWGIPVTAGEDYRLRLLAWRNAAFSGPLTATLESPGGEVLATAELPALSEQGGATVCKVLHATGTCANARLVLSAHCTGTLWFRHVSLMPEATWSGSRVPVRADLAQAIADLKPSFMRFPGGCYVEGDRLEEAFRWKDSIGDLSLRKGHWNRWGYYTSNGFGFHEYLQFCEDLKAEPLFVVNAGMSHTDMVPEERFHECIQDSLDAIEYANGPISTAWGAKRAKNGHPEPFNLKYVEFGNENGGPIYKRNYPHFFRAIKERHPEIQVISNIAEPGGPVEIVDEHYFKNTTEFAAMVTQYDSYERSGPRIYVGEYAAPPGSGLGNSRAALAEAAFMTGMERNSDIVVMASYAPLLVNVADRHWELCAISFDGTRVALTPSYHVQRLFSRNRCARIFPITVEGQEVFEGGGRGLVASFGRNEAGESILKVVNLTPSGHRATIEIRNAPCLKGTAQVIELSAESPDAENTLNHPERIVPKECTFQGGGSNFAYLFPPGSITIMKMCSQYGNESV